MTCRTNEYKKRYKASATPHPIYKVRCQHVKVYMKMGTTSQQDTGKYYSNAYVFRNILIMHTLGFKRSACNVPQPAQGVIKYHKNGQAYHQLTLCQFLNKDSALHCPNQPCVQLAKVPSCTIQYELPQLCDTRTLPSLVLYLSDIDRIGSKSRLDALHITQS